MKITLPKPPVVGEVPAELLDAYPEDFIRSVELEGNDNPPVIQIANHLGSLAAEHGYSSIKHGYDARMIGPGDNHRAAYWHVDAPSLLVANMLPTEFLIGKLNLTRSLRKELGLSTVRDKQSLRLHGLPRNINLFTDAHLQDLGLEIWHAEPYEVVFKNNDVIHRGIHNRTTEPIRRVLASSAVC